MGFYNYRVKRKRRYRGRSTSMGNSYRRRDSFQHRRHHQQRRFRPLKILLAVVLAVVLLAGTGVGAFFYLRSSGRKSLLAGMETEAPNMGESQEVSGTVSRNGRKYTYRQDMINLLCVGVDRTTQLVSDETEIGDNGQADSIFLLALNPTDGTMKVLGISRDTMTEIKTYDHQGNYVGRNKNHLGLAFSYGDGAKKSGELMVDAVSRLLYELPIHGYAAVNMNAIGKLNDSVGGVTVTLPQDMVLAGERFSAGETLTLNGAQAESFVRNRDMEQEGSNNLRMAHQKQYAEAFIRTAKQFVRRDLTAIPTLYGDLTADMATSVDVDEAVYLASLLPGIQFSAEDIQMLEGTAKQGTIYEEFYIDEDALQETILEIFYDEVTDQ